MNIKKYRHHFLLVILLVFSIADMAMAQIEYPDRFAAKLQAARLEFFQPVENQFKTLKIRKNTIADYDFAVRHQPSKVEMRYLVVPDVDNPAEQFPHMSFSNRILTLASNDEELTGDNPISFIQLNQKELSKKYHADWGMTAMFQPKQSFAAYRYCKVLGLYREGHGYCYVIYLFNNIKTNLNEIGILAGWLPPAGPSTN